MTTAKKPVLTLNEVREDVAEVLALIERTRGAGLPEAESLESLKATLTECCETWRKFVDAAAGAVAAGEAVTVHRLLSITAATPEKLGMLALGAAVAPRLDSVLKEVAAAAKKRDDGRLRLTADEKAARLLELRRELYRLELVEESGVEHTGAARRPDANGAAVLGVPADVAEAHGLLSSEVQ